MYKCFLVLAVLGSSTCYHHHGHYGHGYPSHCSHPSHAPSQSDWNFPSHSGHPYGASHPANWNNHGRHGQDGFGWYNPSGDPTGGDNWQWPHEPSQSHNYQNPGQTALKDQTTGVDHHNTPEPEKIGQDEDIHGKTDGPFSKPEVNVQQAFAADDHESNTPSGLEKTDQVEMSNQSADHETKPFQLNDQGVDRQQSDTPSDPRKIGQNRNSQSQTGDSVDKPSQFDDGDSFINSHQSHATSDQEKVTQNGTLRSENVNPVDTPVLFDSDAQNRGDIPKADDMPDPSVDISQAAYSKPLEKNQTSETNKTEAYITGPDNTLELSTIRPQFDLRPIIKGRPVPALEQFPAPSLQWHVGIYTKMETPYSQICGGTLVKTDVVITAAHCFWSDDEGLLQPALFAAAAGKLQRAWDSSADAHAQKSDIREIQTPPRFRGAKASFQDDIAVARLSAPLELAPGVRPACVDFGLALDRQHLTPGNKGTIAGWGLADLNGPPSETLNFLKLPYVDIDQCIQRVPQTFLKYITSDKICAGDWKTGRALCLGDSGGGLIYSTDDVPYLRGVASTAPRDHNQCNAHTVATFTHLASHMTFLTEQVPDITENCRTLYEGTLNETSVVKSNGNRFVDSNLHSERYNSNAESEERKLNVGSQSGLVTPNVADQSGQGKPNVADESGQLKPNVADQCGQPNVIFNVNSADRKLDMESLPLITGFASQGKLECNCVWKTNDNN